MVTLIRVLAPGSLQKKTGSDLQLHYIQVPRHGPAFAVHELPEMSERQGYGVATAQTKLDCVQIDGLVVLKIIKHCRLSRLAPRK